MSSSKPQLPSQYLLIKLQHIQFRTRDQIQDYQFVYFSFALNQRMYFSSCIDTNSPVLSDDLIIPIFEQSLPQTIDLHRWENHMIMLSHQIDISQLKTRSTTKKKHETKAGEILSFMVLVLREEELKFGDKYVSSISQHYLIMQQMVLKENKTQARADQGPSYYLVRASGSDFVMPILDGQICIKLPQTLQFEHIKNGKSAGKSRQYSSDQLRQNTVTIQLTSDRGTTNLQLKLKWGINFFQTKQQNSLLLEAHQLLIYDVQVKFDSYNQYSNSRVKFVYGNKAFQIGNQFNTAKPSKIKKIIYFIIKSQDEEVNIIVQRNLKIVGQSKFYTDQINSYMVHFPKRKIMDQNGKVIGTIKFRCQKAKNLSTPNNNKFWKQSNKKKLINMILLSIQQVSVNYQKDEPLCVTIKSQTQERSINNVPNFMFFDKNLQISYAPTVVSAKPDQSVYLMVKNQQDAKNGQGRSSQDFIGIAVLNFGQLKLGSNSTQITFFKNQGKTATMNCLINKVIPHPFIKSTFQPQSLLSSSSHKTLSLSLFLKRTSLTPYFYTYNYDNKNQLYCIIQVNRLKKVLIMQNTIHNQLQFISSSSSDSLSFYIQDTEYIKVKITFLVSDVGHEEEIYGVGVVKFKIGELNGASDGLRFNRVELKNDFGTDVGFVGIQVHQGVTTNKSKQKKSIQIATGPFKSQIKRVQNDIHKINENMQIMQRSVKKKNTKSPDVQKIRKSQQIHLFTNKRPQLQAQARYDNSVNYSDKRRQRNHSVVGTNNDRVKLPHIKDNNGNKKGGNNLKDLINMMKIRKRDTRGYYEQNSNIKPYQANYPASQRAEYHQNNLSHQYDPPFHTQKGSRQNPQVERSMQMIFPQRKNKKDNIQNQIQEYEEKLKKLKSQLNNYGNANQHDDLDEIMGARISKQNFKKNQKVQQPQRDLEFEDNQFFRAPN